MLFILIIEWREFKHILAKVKYPSHFSLQVQLASKALSMQRQSLKTFVDFCSFSNHSDWIRTTKIGRI